MTQQEFIDRFLQGEPNLSVATYSNLERQGGKRMGELVRQICIHLNLEEEIFLKIPMEFAEIIRRTLPKDLEAEILYKSNALKENITMLLYRLTAYLTEQIFYGQLKKGDKIESDRILAEKLSVGRPAIREALKVLHVMGMIDIFPGQGSYISSDERNFFVMPLSWSLFMNVKQLEDIMAVRELLEVEACRLAAENAGEEDKKRLGEIGGLLMDSFSGLDHKEFVDLDLRFHTCIASCSGNRMIAGMIETICSLMRRINESGMRMEGQIREIFDEHAGIVEAILAGDGEKAAGSMRLHLKNSRERYDRLEAN